MDVEGAPHRGQTHQTPTQVGGARQAGRGVDTGRATEPAVRCRGRQAEEPGQTMHRNWELRLGPSASEDGHSETRNIHKIHVALAQGLKTFSPKSPKERVCLEDMQTPALPLRGTLTKWRRKCTWS